MQMKPIIKTTLFFFLIAFPLFAQTNLKIVTYNIMGMKPGTAPQTRLYHIIQKLKVLDPDIIGLQEINETLSGGGADNQAKLIADSLGSYFGITYHYYYSQTHLSWNNLYKEFVGIISKYPVEQENFAQLAAGAFPRKVVWNHINTPIGKINFFNTHLDYQSTSIRIQQAQQILQFINQQINLFPGQAAILTGDFNDTPGSQPINFLLANSLIDTWQEVNPSMPGFTMPSNAPASKIDFMFKRIDGQLKTDSSWLVMNQPYSPGLFCSDHLGIISIFSLDPTTIREDSAIPEKFNLYQNYPNPFNSTTKIRYSIPFAETHSVTSVQNVVLKVYDILGNEVATLVNNNGEAGVHNIKFNAANLSSGLYFYKIKAGNFTAVKKFVLMK